MIFAGVVGAAIGWWLKDCPPKCAVAPVAPAAKAPSAAPVVAPVPAVPAAAKPTFPVTIAPSPVGAPVVPSANPLDRLPNETSNMFILRQATAARSTGAPVAVVPPPPVRQAVAPIPLRYTPPPAPPVVSPAAVARPAPAPMPVAAAAPQVLIGYRNDPVGGLLPAYGPRAPSVPLQINIRMADGSLVEGLFDPDKGGYIAPGAVLQSTTGYDVKTGNAVSLSNNGAFTVD
jgi:hypothetical protein